MEPPPKKKRGSWTLKQLEDAMTAVRGGMSQRAAAARYSIPRRTLVNHLKSGKVEKQIGRRTILTKEQETDLATRIKRLAAVGLPLKPKSIRHQAYVFCDENDIPNKFNRSKKRAGKDWLKLYLKRNSDISKRKVQILNPGRAQKVNKPIVNQHFNEYKKIYEELIRESPGRLYNMDEKGCRLTIHNQPVVLAEKGAKNVPLVAPEHAENVTIAMCVNAVGTAIPPMILFKGKRMKPEFNDNLPSGSLVRMAKKGSMTTSLFTEFIHHLGKYKTPGKCLLVFDGASCHLDYSIVDAAEKENIVLYCLPSNTTHWLQPLDRSVNKSFEVYWDEEALSYLYQYPGRTITKARFNSILSKIWSKCMTHSNIVNGFKATGLYPFDPNAIPDEAYQPSIPTNHPMQENQVGELDQSQVSPTPGPSGLRAQRATRSHSSDSDETIIDGSPSLIQNYSLPSPVSSVGVKKRLVDYTTTDSGSEESESNTPSAAIRRPITYSSDSSVNMTFSPHKRQPLYSQIYSSSEDDDIVAAARRKERTPIKPVDVSSFVNINKRRREHSSTEDDSEDEVPLVRLKSQKSTKTEFRQLIPTPNLGIVKNTPRRKAINYKARIVTKDLFTERENRKDIQKKKVKENEQKRKEVKSKDKPSKKANSKKECTNKKGKACQTKNSGAIKGKNKGNHADDKWYCYACFTENFEDMRQCPTCQRWYHEECLGLTKDDVDFDCLFCNYN